MIQASTEVQWTKCRGVWPGPRSKREEEAAAPSARESERASELKQAWPSPRCQAPPRRPAGWLALSCGSLCSQAACHPQPPPPYSATGCCCSRARALRVSPRDASSLQVARAQVALRKRQVSNRSLFARETSEVCDRNFGKIIFVGLKMNVSVISSKIS